MFGYYTKEENASHWMSVSDLMSGLMMVFLFIAIVYMMNLQNESRKVEESAKKIERVAITYQKNQVDIYDAMQKEFVKDLEKWGATIDSVNLTLNFQSPDVLFANNEAKLSKEYKKILDDFFPRYIEILKPYRTSISEIRIEGHTSSVGLRGASEDNAYFYNMKLSQDRTRSVLEYGYNLMPTEVDWIRSKIVAVGFSSSQLIKKENGVEDTAKSRRVSFRVITNADIQIKRILETSR